MVNLLDLIKKTSLEDISSFLKIEEFEENQFENKYFLFYLFNIYLGNAEIKIYETEKKIKELFFYPFQYCSNLQFKGLGGLIHTSFFDFLVNKSIISEEYKFEYLLENMMPCYKKMLEKLRVFRMGIDVIDKNYSIKIETLLSISKKNLSRNGFKI